MRWKKRNNNFFYKIGFSILALGVLVWYLAVSFFSPYLTSLAVWIINPEVDEEQMISYAIEKIYKNKSIFQEKNLLDESNIKDIDIKYFNVSNRTEYGNNLKHDKLNMIITFKLKEYLVEVDEPKIEAEIALWHNNFISFTHPHP